MNQFRNYPNSKQILRVPPTLSSLFGIKMFSFVLVDALKKELKNLKKTLQ